MYAKEWGVSQKKLKEEKSIKKQLALKGNPGSKVSHIAPLMWGEHCVECSAPQCYHQCPLYKEREDGRCQLFTTGIIKRYELQGILGYGVEITFRRWGKLEAFCNVGQYSVGMIRGLDSILTGLAKGVKELAKGLPGNKRKWYLTQGFYKVREGLVMLLGKRKRLPQELWLAIRNEEAPFKIVVEVKTQNALKYRTVLTIKTGENDYHIPYAALHIARDEKHYLSLYPEGFYEQRTLILTALDLVTYKEGAIEKRVELPADKVKCVVWDLDETLWKGILIEDGPEGVVLDERVVAVIRELDRRGILNAICSKNDKEPAKKKLEALGLWEYFVAAQINWQPKSFNLEQIGRELNIGLDTFAFIDDSPFEREQVKNKLPMVRCFSEREIDTLLDEKCFQVPVTPDSTRRRATYKMLSLRKQEEQEWQGNIDDFLRSCEMTVTLGTPQKEEIPRCYELLQRTNQLNISGRRLTLQEVTEQIQDPQIDAWVMSCQDKFGDYGIVGFMIIDRHHAFPYLTDLVISCRVANKKVEQGLLLWLAQYYMSLGYDQFNVIFKPSQKNSLLGKVFTTLPFSKAEKEEGWIYTMQYNEELKQDIVVVRLRHEENEGV